ncbi:glutathione S-transferase N-terminal domain-containing protein [Martelella alba]|uniref:glutathione S-transferase N-terminal domain-containing protein n=1 Tax=Martelella alba TaxID=2590451 RepID=UPI001E362922|nr:glutathione S-transferase N-terminal domain-containing protein [Martelella alba]
MKLYVYDHCPYCVRARMPFALKNIPFEPVFVPNDDEDTPIHMISRKMLPILEDTDGCMGESLDIWPNGAACRWSVRCARRNAVMPERSAHIPCR